MAELINREFIVNAPLETAWRHLTRLDQWPRWAHHIKRIEAVPKGELGPHSTGFIHLANGLKSTFRMTEYNAERNWKWVGKLFWLTIVYDHAFESLSSHQTKIKFVVVADGFAAGSLGRLFAKIYRPNLEKAIPRLVSEIEQNEM